MEEKAAAVELESVLLENKVTQNLSAAYQQFYLRLQARFLTSTEVHHGVLVHFLLHLHLQFAILEFLNSGMMIMIGRRILICYKILG